MYNSFELLIFGSSISNIQKQYNILSEMVRDHNGKVHRSKREYFNWFKGFIDKLFLKVKEKKKSKDLVIVLKDRNIVIKNYCINL
jgi:hypothetical protein